MYVPHLETLEKEDINAANHRCVPVVIHGYTSVDDIVFHALLVAELGRAYVSAYHGWVHIDKPYNLEVFRYTPREGILTHDIKPGRIKDFVKIVKKKCKREFHSTEMKKYIYSYLGITPEIIDDLIEKNRPDEKTKEDIIKILLPSMSHTPDIVTTKL
jgi:hypothetical protein